MLKVDEQNVWEAEDWVSTLQKALKHYMPAAEEDNKNEAKRK